jgi:peptide/nickel transport system substrate-binding protein
VIVYEYIKNIQNTMPLKYLKKHNRLISFLLFILLMNIAFSCGKPDDTPGQKNLPNENVLRYDVNAPFTSLNPPTVKASGSNHIFPLLYSYLFIPDCNGILKPDLAAKWIFDPEKLQWIIYLKSDAVFHNNKPVTSKDVIYSYKKWINIFRPNLSSVISQIYMLSDTSLCICLKNEDPLILQKIWDFEIFSHPDAGEIDYYNHPIGSGPFNFKKRHADEEIHLEANANYYNGRPSLNKIIFYYQPDKEKSWVRLLAGETDIAQEITPKNYKMIRQYKDRFYFNRYTLHYYTILLYNSYDPLFSNPKVRRALSLAIDREYIVENILNGFGRVANGPMGVGSPYHNPEVKPVPFDPQRALALLKEAGWSHDAKGRLLYKDGKPFEFTLLVYKEYQIEKKVARFVQLCLNDIGIQVNLRTLPYKVLQRKWDTNIEFQVVLTELSGVYRNPEDLKDYWIPGTDGKSIVGCFEHPEVTRLIQKAFDEKNQEKQKGLFYKVEALITSLQPGTFLFQKTAIDVMSKRFHLPYRFSLSYEGTYRLRYASLDQDWKNS